MKISETKEDFKAFIAGTLGYGTCRAYEKTLNRFIRQAGDRGVGELNLRDFAEYKMNLAMKKRTNGYIAGEISALCCYLEFLKKTYQVKEIDIEDIRDLRPRVRSGEPNLLEPWQYDALVESADAIEDHALIVLLFNAGLRISEAIGLTKDSLYEKEMVSDDGLTYRAKLLRVIGKGNKERSVPLNQKAEGVLVKYMSFLEMKHPKGYSKFFSYGYTTAWRKIKGIGEKAGIPVHPHQLRHSFATEMLKAGVDIVTIAKIMGHESLDTTKKYTKIVDATMIHAVKRLDSAVKAV